MPPNPDKLPELMIAVESESTTARRIQRLAAEGRLRRLYAGIYTSNLDSPPDAVVLRHWRTIVGHRPNQAGNTYFVVPERVPGTLREGFECIQSLIHPLAQAIMTMFVITEVHPFLDGNGRTARLAMNCVLSAAGFSRIVVPTVYRDDYLLPLKALSHSHIAEPLIASMIRIQRWSAAFNYRLQLPELRKELERCNAFQEDLHNYRLVFPS